VKQRSPPASAGIDATLSPPFTPEIFTALPISRFRCDSNVRADTTIMTDAVQAPQGLRDADPDKPHDAPIADFADSLGSQKATQNAPSFDVKALTDRTLHFLATASNETLGACLVGLSAGTYFILGRVGLVLIGVVGGVVLHATWEGHAQHGDKGETTGTSAEARRRELGADIAHRVLDWRDARAQDRDSGEDDTSDLSLKLYSGQPLDFSEFKPETAAALTELTDAVIRDYVKYVPGTMSVDMSNREQMVVFASSALRRRVPQFMPPDIHCSHPLHVLPPRSQATSRQLR
jgi:hypothetical protein